MEPTTRLYQCVFCHVQVIICRKCDRGNIYCANGCANRVRTISLRLARARYQSTLKGRHLNAARQARYRKNHQKKVTDQGSLPTVQYVSIKSLENKPEKTENGQQNTVLICCFCKKPISAWIRNDFLRRRGHKELTGLQASPQAP